VRQVGYLQGLYRDTRSREHKILMGYFISTVEPVLNGT